YIFKILFYFFLNIIFLILSCFKRNKKSIEVKILAVLEYIFHGSYRKVSKVLSLSIETISKSTIHDLSKKFSKEIKI
ncbi:MAG: hypothetical protein QXE38_02010, partial [Candidatus Methanomethylicia archaeon]